MLKDIRRLTGRNFLMDVPGAAAEAMVSDKQKPLAIVYWREAARALMNAIGWQDEKIAMRAFEGGITLMISAPHDALYAATELVEKAWEQASDRLEGRATTDISGFANELQEKVVSEANPAELSLKQAAAEKDVTFLGSDPVVSLGLGTGSQSFDASNLPDPEDIDWAKIHDIPSAMVTGTNGKSTTVRLTAAIGQAAGRSVGLSSSDWVRVGDEILDEGDYSGPAGARLAVRDNRVELAIIETARGGLMRRGLPIPQADACLLTNIAADHLGTYGICDVPSLADAKFLLAKAVRPGGRLILNADDPELVNRATGYDGEITWFGLNIEPDVRDNWIASGGHMAFVKDGEMMLARDGKTDVILPVVDFPPALGGAAKFNISNGLAAIALASALNLPVEAMKNGLAGFTNNPDENPGRGNFFEFGGIKVLVDFAHNPHGISALAEGVREVEATRRLFLAGQAGDRSDQDTRDMIDAIWEAQPDMVVTKELPKKLRGRALGELTKVMLDELRELGAGPENMLSTDDEYSAVEAAFNWARAGDFLILLLHEDRAASMELINRLQNSGWQAGQDLPIS